MEFGIALSAGPNAGEVARRAEELGFTHAWFYDTQLLAADVFVAMTAAAVQTSRIKLGTGVLIPTNRIAPVTANALASLNALAPGRIIFGAGTGFTGRNTMGLKAMPLADFRSYLHTVGALLDEETVAWEFEGRPRKIRFLNPELGLINTRDEIPLHLSAFGPKARQLTAEIADGWINFGGPVEPALRQSAQMAEAWSAAGREDDCYRSLFTLGCVLAEGEGLSSPRVMAQAGPLAAVALHGLIESGQLLETLPEPVRSLALRYLDRYEHALPAGERHLWLHRGHLMFVRPDEADLVTPELIAARTFTGTQADLRDRFRALAEGYDQFVVQLVPGQEDAIEEWAALAATV
jgi:5,10-methylenetetrahydromethanopterin reductase